MLAELEGDDLMLCQISSRAISDRYAVSLTDADFAQGGLRLESNVRPNRLFTADNAIVLYRVGSLVRTKFNEVVDRVISILRA